MEKKKCKSCLEIKCVSMFYKHTKSKDGFFGKCKECKKSESRDNQKKVGSMYDNSEKGIFRVIYKTQKRNQRIRGHGDMPYSKKDLIKWCIGNGFSNLFAAWVNSGHKTDLKPSIDRINDNYGYSLDNISLVTWGENRSHQASDISIGFGPSGKRCKPVLKTYESGDVISEYVSLSSAKRDVGYCIWRNVKESIPCRNGFLWRYK